VRDKKGNILSQPIISGIFFGMVIAIYIVGDNASFKMTFVYDLL